MSETAESTAAALHRLENDLAATLSQIEGLRRGLLRSGAVVAVVLLVLGLVLPMYTVIVDEKPATVRVLTAAFQILSDPADGGYRALGIVVGIGFLGLSIAVVMLIGILLFSVIGGAGKRRYAWIRNILGVLACIGSVVALIFSAIGWSSHESGGWGPLVLLLSVVLTLVIIKRFSWQALWVVDDDRVRLATSSS